jgi:uncharacterized protein (DUF58 family)
MAGVAMLHTWRNLAHLSCARAAATRCSRASRALRRDVETPSRTRFSIALRRAATTPCSPTRRARDRRALAAGARARRGLHAVRAVEVFTRYPVGLFHAWSYVDFDLHVLVYPKPDPPAARRRASRQRDEEGIPVPGDEEFNMLRAYRRATAQADRVEGARARAGLLTKEFSATASSELWLDWRGARGPTSRRACRSSRTG